MSEHPDCAENIPTPTYDAFNEAVSRKRMASIVSAGVFSLAYSSYVIDRECTFKRMLFVHGAIYSIAGLMSIGMKFTPGKTVGRIMLRVLYAAEASYAASTVLCAVTCGREFLLPTSIILLFNVLAGPPKLLH
jgi:hypothetical protein